MSAQKWAVPLLFTFFLLTSACKVVSAASTQGGVVQIISPPKNGKAGPTQPVSGKAQLSKGYTLWIVPYDPAGGVYYPQANPLTMRSDATWSTRLSVGNIFGVGKIFQIHAVVANARARSALNNYAAQRTAVSKLPQGAQAVDAVTVTRVAKDVFGIQSVTPSATATARATTASTLNAKEEANRSATNVAIVSKGVNSGNLLPGFDALSALGALVAIFIAVRRVRQL